MRTLIVALLATTLLSGCAAVAIEGGLAEGALGAGAGEATLAAGMGAAEIGAAAPIEVSADLEALTSEQGTLSNWLADFARNGRSAYLEPGGILDANGQRLASINAQDGVIRGRSGTAVGYISNSDGYIYEYVRNGSPQAVGVLEGWIPQNGVELTTNLNSTTGVQVLQPNVLVRVSEIGNGQYQVTLPSGATGWVPAGAMTLMILALGQQSQDCPQDGRGAIVRKSGEEIAFRSCRKVDGAFVIDTPNGVLVVDALDVDSILTGDRVPGIDQMVYAANETPPPFALTDPTPAAVDQPPSDRAVNTADANAPAQDSSPSSPALSSSPSITKQQGSSVQQQSSDWTGLDGNGS